MGDRYLYDQYGQFIGTFSDKPPVYGGCFLQFFGIALVVGITKTAIYMIHPPPNLTSQLLGRWQNDRGGVTIQYAPNHTYAVANLKSGKTLEAGTWNLDEMTILYHITSGTAEDAEITQFRHLQQLDGKTLVMDQEAFQRVEAGR